MRFTRIADGFVFTEGPLWIDEGIARAHSFGERPGLFFSDIEADRQYFHADGEARVVRDPSGQANGTALTPAGDILSCEHQTRRVSIRRTDGSVDTLVDRVGRARLNSPNDICVLSDDSIAFTDPPYGVDADERELPFCGVYRVGPDGEVSVIDDRLEKPNGVALHPDGESLVVADTETGSIYAYRSGPDERWERRELTRVPRPDGLAYDETGALIIAALDGLAVFDESQGSVHTLQMSERPANLCFGGKSRRDLFVCARTSLLHIDWPNRGLRLH